MWKRIRVGVLLLILLVVASDAWLDRQRTRSWQQTVWVGIYPIAGDASAATAAYVASLRRGQFAEIEAFYAREARRYGIALDPPVRIELYPPLPRAPPLLAADAGPLARLLWSLKLRLYAWNMPRAPAQPAPHIRLFVLYHDPALARSVPASHAMQKGLVGIVHAFAAPAAAGSNNLVIAHEALHTFGATDKYDPRTNLPLFPDGYGDPGATPLYPQAVAEIMAGRRALTATRDEDPQDLDEVVVGPRTAREINWLKP
jgi:hypothetical protein